MSPIALENSSLTLKGSIIRTVPHDEPVAPRGSKRQGKDIIVPINFVGEGDEGDLPETSSANKSKRTRSTSSRTRKRLRTKENSRQKKTRSKVGSGKYKCDRCPTTFTKEQDVKRHIRTVHEGASKVFCGCSRSYSRPDSLKRHLDSKKCEPFLERTPQDR